VGLDLDVVEAGVGVEVSDQRGVGVALHNVDDFVGQMEGGDQGVDVGLDDLVDFDELFVDVG